MDGLSFTEIQGEEKSIKIGAPKSMVHIVFV